MSAVEENAQSADYVEFWNEILVPKFIKYKHILVDGLTHHSEAIFPSLQVKEGDKVLDVGCGFGDTAMQLAERVGQSGKVVGLDCCNVFLDYGRKDAASRGLTNVSFIEGDALLQRFEPEYDFVFSRFGTMFFSNPVAGLKNMRSALKPGAIMTHIVWRTRSPGTRSTAQRRIANNSSAPIGSRNGMRDTACLPLTLTSKFPVPRHEGFLPEITQDEESITMPSASFFWASMTSASATSISPRFASASSPASRNTSPAGPMASWKLMASSIVLPTRTGASTRLKVMFS